MGIWEGLRLEVERAVNRRRGGGGCGSAGAGAAVAGLGLLADQPREVRQERELLAHQRAVDPVLARDLGEQAAQLRGALAGGASGAGGDERAQALKCDVGGGRAERGAGALEQPGAVGLEPPAAG